MTLLQKRLRRETSDFLSVDRFSRGRPIIIEIEPPNLVHFRWKGMRTKYTATVARLFQWTITATVEARRKEKKRRD